jgi:AcrR family transcriptional regulator
VFKLGLLERNKAERRGRILAAARRLIARHGYDGLTMRALAEASEVSVPTLYNLYGGKHQILAAGLTEQFEALAGLLASEGRGDFVDRVFAVHDVAVTHVLEAPGYFRELIHVFLTSRDTDELRRAIEQRHIAAMAAHLRAAQGAGELVAWVDAELLAGHLFFQLMMTFLGWAKGELTDDVVGAVATYGVAISLLGVAEPNVARRLERRAKDAQRQLAATRR